MKSERGKIINRLIDFYIGIPIIIFLSFFKRKNNFINLQVSKIGIISLAAIGDSILSSIIIKSLQDKYPCAIINIYVTKSNKPFYEFIKNKNIIINEINIYKLSSSLKKFISDENDLIIDTSQWIRLSALYSFISGAKFTIGFNTKNQWRHFLYDCSVEHKSSSHEIENYRNLLGPLKINCVNEASFLDFNIKFDNIKLPDCKYIVIHPWAGGYKNSLREWPINNWIRICNFMISNGYNVIITGSKNDYIKSQEIISKVENKLSITALDGSLNFNQLASFLINSDLVISVNTGIMHFTAFLNKKLISLNGPTNINRWGALGKLSVNIAVPSSEGGQYLNLGFEYNSNNYIMDKITVNSVINQIKLIIFSKEI